MLIFGVPHPPPKPEKPEKEAEPEELKPEDDAYFEERLVAFLDLGFDQLEALTLAWEKVSPSDVRERFLKKGATHDQVCQAVL